MKAHRNNKELGRLAEIRFHRPGRGIIGSFGCPSEADLMLCQNKYDAEHAAEIYELNWLLMDQQL